MHNKQHAIESIFNETLIFGAANFFLHGASLRANGMPTTFMILQQIAVKACAANRSSGVKITNVLRAGFVQVDPKSIKKYL